MNAATPLAFQVIPFTIYTLVKINYEIKIVGVRKSLSFTPLLTSYSSSRLDTSVVRPAHSCDRIARCHMFFFWL